MKEVLIVAVAPCIVIFLVLGWMWLISRRTKHSSINISGLGLNIAIEVDGSSKGRDLEKETKDE